MVIDGVRATALFFLIYEFVLSPNDSAKHVAGPTATGGRAAGGPPDRTRIVEIMRRHGLTSAPPDGASR
jgi:hypothetical protein